MIYIRVAPAVRDDISAIAVSDRRAAAKLLVLLEEISVNQNILGDLVTHGATVDTVPSFREATVKRIGTAARDHGVPLWRLSCIDLTGWALPYRILYLYEQARAPGWKPTLHVIAAARRSEIDYDDPDNAYIARAYLYWRSL